MKNITKILLLGVCITISNYALARKVTVTIEKSTCGIIPYSVVGDDALCFDPFIFYCPSESLTKSICSSEKSSITYGYRNTFVLGAIVENYLDAQYSNCTDSEAEYKIVDENDSVDCVTERTEFVKPGCTLANSPNYDYEATENDGSCISTGCTDSMALNYDSNANSDDGSCIAPGTGCTDNVASNYNPSAQFEDGSCIYYGCTDSMATNFDSNANSDDGSCIAPGTGCTDSVASNYNPSAQFEDGSCTYPYVDECGVEGGDGSSC